MNSHLSKGCKRCLQPKAKEWGLELTDGLWVALLHSLTLERWWEPWLINHVVVPSSNREGDVFEFGNSHKFRDVQILACLQFLLKLHKNTGTITLICIGGQPSTISCKKEGPTTCSRGKEDIRSLKQTNVGSFVYGKFLSNSP